VRWKTLRDGTKVPEIDYVDARRKRRRLLVPGRTKAEARADLAELVVARDRELRGLSNERGLSMPIGELVEQYLGVLRTRATPKFQRAARAALARMVKQTGMRTARDATREVVSRFREKRLAAGASKKTVNTEVAMLFAAFQVGIERGQFTANPLLGLKRLKVLARDIVRPPRALSDDELSRVLAAAARFEEGEGLDGFAQGPLYLALAWTGARVSELTKATWADVDLAHGTLKLRAETTKTQVERTLPLRRELWEELARLPAEHRRVTGHSPRSSTRIFLSCTGKPFTSTGHVLRRLLVLFKRCGVEHVDSNGRHAHVHGFRHTFATRLKHAGVPQDDRERLTGHASGAMIDRYTHLDCTYLRKAIESLPPLGVVVNLESASERSGSPPPSPRSPADNAVSVPARNEAGQA
jgi:integrase/recombinase XerD